MKVDKKKVTQATAVILALILMLAGVCTGGFSNLYSLKRSIADGTDTTKEITAFDALSGSVSTQELAVGAKESDIVFPKELKATMVERKKVAATVNETKPASVDNNAQKEGTVVPAVNPAEAAPTQTPAQALEGAQQSTPAQTPAASESAAPESAPASTEGSSENTSGGSNAAENESTAPTNNDSSSESGNGLIGSVRKLTQIFALRSDSTNSSTDTQMTETASGETTTSTNAAGTENGTQTTTTGTDAQTTTGTPTETVGGTSDATAVSTPETSVPTSEAATETTNNTIANPETPAAQPAASTVTVSEIDKDKFETTTTQAITLSDISWRIDAGASSGSAFSSEKAGATFVYAPVISGDYTVSADLPRITVKIVDELRPAVELTQIVDGIKITLRAEKGVFPAGVTMTARRVTDYEEDNVENAVEEVRNETKNVVDSYTFDIKVLDKNGNEIQPDTSKGKVSVSFTMEEVTNDNLEADVYHIKGKELSMSAEELNEKTTNGDTVEAKTDGFSYYTVEFTYNDLQYVLPGGSVVPLSQILTAVGLTGTVEDARGSNPELFTVGKVAVQADGTPVRDALGNPIADEKGVWYVVSKAAFSTDEWMKVTIAGVEYEIKVTDDQGKAIHDYAELQAATDTSKQYYLANDIELTNPWTVSANGIKLDLKGFGIKQTASDKAVIDIKGGGQLTLTDTNPQAIHKFSVASAGNWELNPSGGKQTTGGFIYGGRIGIKVASNGTLNMTGGTVVGVKTDANGVAYSAIINNGTVILRDVTICGNYSVMGGGIYNKRNLTMTGGTIEQNTASMDGGGLYNYLGTVELNNVSIKNNKVSPASFHHGGGIFNSGGQCTMTGGTIAENTAYTYGGGIYNGNVYIQSSGRVFGTMTLNNVTIENNTASTETNCNGGGIYNAGAQCTITGGTIANNKAYSNGGGIYNGSINSNGLATGTMTLANVTISENIAGDGAGIFNYGGNLAIKGGSISGNKSGGVGHGIKNLNDASTAPSQLNIEGKIVIENNISNNQNLSPANLYLNKVITISGSLSKDSKIYVTLAGTPGTGTVTSGFGTYHSTDPAYAYFAPDNPNYWISKENGEAVLIPKGTVTPPTLGSIAYGQTLGDITMTGGSVTDGSSNPIAGTFSWEDPSIKPAVSDSGQTNYNLVFTSSNEASPQVRVITPTTVTVNRAPITPTVSINGWKYSDAPNTPTVTGNPGGGTVTYYYKVKGADDNTYTEAVPTVAGTYVVKADVAETANYEAGSATAEFEISRIPISPIVAINGWKVGAAPYPPSVTGNTGGGAVTYSYKVKGAGDETYSSTVPTKVGTYTVKADIAQTAAYAAGSATADFVIFQKDVETKTESKDGAPTVSVEGLADVLTDAEKSAAGATSVYEINFTADKKTESTAAGVPQIKALLAGNQQLETLLDLTLYKTTTTLASDSTKTITKTENIGGTNKKVLGLAIPYQTAGRTLLLLRFHGGAATKLTALNAKPTGGYTDGTYFIDTANNMIYVYASGYSTYAIAVETASGGGSSSGGSSSGGSSSSGSSSSSSSSSNNSNNNAPAAADQAAQAAAQAQAAAAQAAAAQAAANNPAAVQPAAENAKVQNTKASSAKKSNGTAEASADAGSSEESVTEDITDYQPTTDTDKTTMTAKVTTDEPKQTTSNTEVTPKKNKGLGILLLILLLVVAGGVILVATSTVGKRKNQ